MTVVDTGCFVDLQVLKRPWLVKVRWIWLILEVFPQRCKCLRVFRSLPLPWELSILSGPFKPMAASIMSFFFLIYIFICLHEVLVVACKLLGAGIWKSSSLTRDGSQAPCIRSAKS